MTPCYALKYVRIKKETVGSRPIGWDSEDIDGFGHNSDGKDVKAVRWATTCPCCGNLLEFNEDEVHKSNKEEIVGCTNCKAGIDLIPEKSKVALDISEPMDLEKLIADSIQNVEFCDPIADGVFDVEIDIERMPGLTKQS